MSGPTSQNSGTMWQGVGSSDAPLGRERGREGGMPGPTAGLPPARPSAARLVSGYGSGFQVSGFGFRVMV